MIWKIIGYIVLLTILVLFITLNISHTSDISFIVYTAENVPIYVAIFISMLIGCLFMGIVWILTARKNRKQVHSYESESESESGDSIEEKFEQNFGQKSSLTADTQHTGSSRKKGSRKGKKNT